MTQGSGLYTNTSFIFQFFILLGLCMAGLIFSQLLFISFTFLQQGFSPEKVMKVIEALNSNGDTLRTFQFFYATLTFLLPAVLAAKFFGGNEKEYLYIETPVSLKTIILAIAGIIVVIPFINALAWLNTQIHLPESMSGIETFLKTTEEGAKQTMELMLYTNKPSALLMNILIIAVLAAISEEFLFRGVLQNIFGKIIPNPHVVIWVVAFIFSAVHFQFYGFIPRMLLGAYLGYLLHYSKCIWVPVIAHFVQNLIGVIPYYKANSETIAELDAIGTGANWWIAIVSFCLWLVLFVGFRKSCKMPVNPTSSPR